MNTPRIQPLKVYWQVQATHHHLFVVKVWDEYEPQRAFTVQVFHLDKKHIARAIVGRYGHGVRLIEVPRGRE